MRRLMNCAPFLDWRTKVKHLSDFSHAMLISGYNHQYRYDIISGLIVRYNQISSSVSDGTREWYKSKCQTKEDKQRKGGNNAATWHLKGDTRHTLAVPITPHSALAKTVKTCLKDTVAPDGGETLVVERGGQPITSGIILKDPFKPEGCRYNNANCIVDAKTGCMTVNIVYQIDCQEQVCQDARDHPEPDAIPRRSSYFGQSGRSMHARAAEHAAGLRNQNPACPLTKHALEYYANDLTLPGTK